MVSYYRHAKGNIIHDTQHGTVWVYYKHVMKKAKSIPYSSPVPRINKYSS